MTDDPDPDIGPDLADRAAEMKRRALGAVYDFAAWLTTRREPVTIGETHDAAIVAELVREFASRRGMADLADIPVIEWDQPSLRPQPDEVADVRLVADKLARKGAEGGAS